MHSEIIAKKKKPKQNKKKQTNNQTKQNKMKNKKRNKKINKNKTNSPNLRSQSNLRSYNYKFGVANSMVTRR